MTSSDEAGVGNEQRATEAKIASELTQALDRATTEDDACPRLIIEGRHGLQ
jgi:hypothetical protein